jgi:hypothetical protein
MDNALEATSVLTGPLSIKTEEKEFAQISLMTDARLIKACHEVREA